MDRYSASVAHRVPASTGPPTFTELGAVIASGLFFSEELSRDGEHSVSTSPETLDPSIKTAIQDALDNTDSLSGLELWIHRHDVRVARGPIIGIQVQGEANTWTFRAAGPLYYARYMYLREASTLTFTNIDQHTIAKTLIDNWQALQYGHFGLDTSSITASGTTRDRTYTPGDSVYQRLIELAEVDNGFDVWVDGLEVNLGTKGSDLTNSVVLDRRGISDASLAISLAAGDIASEAYARSTEEAPVTAERSNTTLRQSFGRTGIAAGFDKVTKQATINDHAQALLDARVRPLISPQPRLIPVAGAGVLDFSIGDAIQFVPKIGIDGVVLNRRVLRKTVTVSDDGAEEIGVALA